MHLSVAHEVFHHRGHLGLRQAASKNGQTNGKAVAAAEASDDQTRPPTTPPHALGEMVWLMSQSKGYKHHSFSDIEWLLMPPLAALQFRLFHDGNRPVGLALWAHLSDEAEAQFLDGRNKIRPDEWKSGDNLWLIDLIAPFATAENKQSDQMMAALIQSVFKDKPFKIAQVNKDTGKREAKELRLQVKAEDAGDK